MQRQGDCHGFNIDRLDQALVLGADRYRDLIWTAGARANPLAAQISGERDPQGRVSTDPYLRAPEAAGVFLTGDVARVAADTEGNFAMMSCQHALIPGRVAGITRCRICSALSLHAYSQPGYTTCLDLGGEMAMVTMHSRSRPRFQDGEPDDRA